MDNKYYKLILAKESDIASCFVKIINVNGRQKCRKKIFLIHNKTVAMGLVERKHF